MIIHLKIARIFPELIEDIPFYTLLFSTYPLLFYLLNIHLFKGISKVPFRSLILFILMLVLDVIFFIVSIPYGLRWQGTFYVIISLLINLISISIILFLYYRNYKKPSYSTNLLFNFCVLFWFLWIAFPLFGELGF